MKKLKKLFLLKFKINENQQNIFKNSSNKLLFYCKQKCFPLNNFFSCSTTEATVPLKISKLELCQSYSTENSHSLCTFTNWLQQPTIITCSFNFLFLFNSTRMLVSWLERIKKAGMQLAMNEAFISVEFAGCALKSNLFNHNFCMN